MKPFLPNLNLILPNLKRMLSVRLGERHSPSSAAKPVCLSSGQRHPYFTGPPAHGKPKFAYGEIVLIKNFPFRVTADTPKKLTLKPIKVTIKE